MPVARRTKILNEFTEGKEVEAVAEILKLLRQGAPEVPLIDQQKAEFEKLKTESQPPESGANPLSGPEV
jgi:hypothetical protein